VLTGDAIVNLAEPAAAEVEGTWRVESATDGYAGHDGGGTITGRADMTLPQPRGNVRYAGHLVAGRPTAMARGRVGRAPSRAPVELILAMGAGLTSGDRP
jgi:hypothetical protein